jgi:hypothetical protein
MPLLLAWLFFVPLMFVLWVVLGLLMLPFLVLKVAFRLLAALVVIPIVFVLGVVGLVVAGVAVTAALLVPLVPFALAGLLVWLILRAARPRVA